MLKGYWKRGLFLLTLGLFMALFVWLVAWPVSTGQAHTDDPGDTIFEDMSVPAGITATHTTDILIIGQAWGDVNRDGWPDLYVTDDVGPNTLFLNDGDGTFSVAPYNMQVALPGAISAGAIFGDYNNDGWLDLYVLNLGANALFMNDGGTGFVNVTDSAGVGDVNRGQTGMWGDYDRDGNLDLFVVNYNCTECPDENRDVLYHNNGDGTFTDVTAALVEASIRKPGFTGSFLDFDNDGDLDIYVVNDFRTRNVLWRNDGPGCTHWCFTDVSAAAGADTRVDGMGLAVGDYDNDNDLDLYFSHNGPAVLLQNQTSQGSPTFLDATAETGVGFAAMGWGAVFFDCDNDGWLDLYLATGNPLPELSNRLFRNLGDGTFVDETEMSGAANLDFSMGVATSDYDRDGWVDFVLGNRHTDYVLYRNQGMIGSTNNWLTVHLTGGSGMNRDAIGARVVVYTSDWRTMMQEIKSGSSLGAGNDLALHFGLGEANAVSVDVLWPNGLVTTTFGPFENQELSLSFHDLATQSYLPALAYSAGE